MHLDQNLKGLCAKNGINFNDFLNDMDVDHVNELTIYDLEAICEEYEVDILSLLFKPLMKSDHLQLKISKIKLLVLDVDGVMTDGGMYYNENGDFMKKYNTKDGMAIQQLVKNNFQVAIISSGFKEQVVKTRADLLGIQHCVVTREPKLNVLKNICNDLKLSLDEVALIGDDVNDIEMIANIGLSACPSDAVGAVKTKVDLILSKKGGEGCVREFIDAYLLTKPLN
jgi:3-deoxy-D-manno-octulosonate 8-phosphate phosphatase (KDO 8-P phosphatase)